ncbi:MAG: thiosulfate oxidation carrier complex protein SoxZ [Burkholderiales bacterium]|nr:MAG: thiosulfate oxidation carrier complex protein SoxZ [Burkholderiales bacterium]
MTTGALVRVPPRARRGEVVEITAMAAHPMETGLRPGADGRLVARNIVHTFTCRYDGAEVFRAELHPAVTANPYFAFTTVATRSGPLEFRWEDERGEVIVATATIVVE